MRAVIMRVNDARVEVEGEAISEIKKGVLVFVAVKKDDEEKDAEFLAKKIATLRIFDSEKSNFDLSVKDVNGEIMVVSEFTLYGNIRKGRRPSFDASATREKGEILYRAFIDKLKEIGLKVKEGSFGANMIVKLSNDGPVTFIFDTRS